MAKPEIFHYSIPCRPAALSYFKNGVRKGSFISLNGNYGEYAPLDIIHKNTLSFRFALSMCKAFGFIKKRFCIKNGVVKQAGFINSKEIGHVLERAKSLVDNGYESLKIKVNAHDVDYEIEKIKKVKAIVGEKILLRIDANKSFDLNAALYFLNSLKDVNIEYIEEPLINLSDLSRLHMQTKVEMALDESFSSLKDLDFMLQTNIKYLVLKPSRFDSLFKVIKIITRAKEKGLKIIFSPCFETELTASIFSVFIDHFELSEVSHGLYIDNFLNPLMHNNNFLASKILVKDAVDFLNEFNPLNSPYVKAM